MVCTRSVWPQPLRAQPSSPLGPSPLVATSQRGLPLSRPQPQISTGRAPPCCQDSSSCWGYHTMPGFTEPTCFLCGAHHTLPPPRGPARPPNTHPTLIHAYTNALEIKTPHPAFQQRRPVCDLLMAWSRFMLLLFKASSAGSLCGKTAVVRIGVGKRKC